MKILTQVLAGLTLFASLSLAAGVDGKWTSERKMDRNGESVTIKQLFDLKADGGKLTGTIAMSFGDTEPRSSKISNGKIDGDKFSFEAVMSTPNGEMKTVYEGKVDGDSIKGTSAREGGQSRPFEAKRQ